MIRCVNGALTIKIYIVDNGPEGYKMTLENERRREVMMKLFW